MVMAERRLFSPTILRSGKKVSLWKIRFRNALTSERVKRETRAREAQGYICSAEGCQLHSSVTTGSLAVRRRWFNLAG